MKRFKLLGILFVITLLSIGCKDTTKEDKEAEQAVQSIDSLETVIETSTENVEDAASEAEIALKDLDSI